MKKFNKQFNSGGNVKSNFLKNFKQRLVKIYDKKQNVERIIMKNDKVLMRDYEFEIVKGNSMNTFIKT